MADGIMNKLGQGMDAKLEHDLSAVSFDGSGGDSQLGCNFLVRFSLGQEADDFELAWTCSGPCPFPLLMLVSCFEKPIQHDFGDLGR